MCEWHFEMIFVVNKNTSRFIIGFNLHFQMCSASELKKEEANQAQTLFAVLAKLSMYLVMDPLRVPVAEKYVLKAWLKI